mmetsp:Transcript_3700/g.9507  ORF Transcript_3700/g.9507 Transcript_3700/m.9507 type:complete len:280 (+) Transcript_3700:693-1532(+)
MPVPRITLSPKRPPLMKLRPTAQETTDPSRRCAGAETAAETKKLRLASMVYAAPIARTFSPRRTLSSEGKKASNVEAPQFKRADTAQIITTAVGMDVPTGHDWLAPGSMRTGSSSLVLSLASGAGCGSRSLARSILQRPSSTTQLATKRAATNEPSASTPITALTDSDVAAYNAPPRYGPTINERVAAASRQAMYLGTCPTAVPTSAKYALAMGIAPASAPVSILQTRNTGKGNFLCTVHACAASPNPVPTKLKVMTGFRPTLSERLGQRKSPPSIPSG